MPDLREQAAVLALTAATAEEKGEWYRTAQLLQRSGSAIRLLRGDVEGLDAFEAADAMRLAGRVTDEAIGRYEQMISSAADDELRLVTVLDEEYPPNLRLIYNLPPFLFVRGELLRRDDDAIAVVGTRKPSDEGREQAEALASGLAARGITVLSGLAAGIDSEAHRATLREGGRTEAVMGTGIRTVYPEENAGLAEEILAKGGALVSQFWPDAPPTRYSFPMRNVVMSGMAKGTVVIEASSTSGAKSQATKALDHGKRLFLVRKLVLTEEWARRYAERRGAIVFESVDDILAILGRDSEVAQGAQQLTLG